MEASRGGRPIAVVTGASSGIGAAFAEELARLGHDLIVVSRDRERLSLLSRGLADRYDIAVEVLAADLTGGTALREVEHRLVEHRGIEVLVNNAGISRARSFARLDPDTAQAIVTLQTVVVMRLTRAVLPRMIEQRHGAIVNVSSAAVFAPAAYYAAYNGGKAFINAFTETLALELAGTGVMVQALCPWMTRTELFERGGVDVSRVPEADWMSAADVARASLAGLRLGEVVCVPGLEDDHLLADDRELRTAVIDRLTGTVARRYLTTPPRVA